MAIVTYNDNGTIKVVKFGNYVVSTDADPVVQKKWVFDRGSSTPQGTTYELKGLMDAVHPGCASASILYTELTSRSNPNELAVGTQAAIRLNADLGTDTCDTWAIFEV